MDTPKKIKIGEREFDPCPSCGKNPAILPVQKMDKDGKLVMEMVLCIPCANSIYEFRENLGLKNIVR